MNKLALTLPGSSPIPAPVGLKTEFKDLASLLSPLLNIVFYVALFLAFYFLVWGAFAYIMAGGKNEALAIVADPNMWWVARYWRGEGKFADPMAWAKAESEATDAYD